MIERLLSIIHNSRTILIETILRELKLEYKNTPVALDFLAETIEVGDFVFDYEIIDRYVDIIYLEDYRRCDNMDKIINFIDNCIGEDNARKYKTL